MWITMNLLVLICSVFLFLSKSHAFTDVSQGDCELGGFTEDTWKLLVVPGIYNDTSVNETVFQTSYKNIESSEDTCETENCFFRIDFDKVDEILFIVITDEILKIDGVFKNQSSPKEISTTIKLNCATGTRLLIFKVTINDTNNHAPTFEKSNYEYSIPFPMPPKIDLTQFGENIKATDLDFSNNDMTFSSDLDGLKCTTVIHENDPYPYFLRLEFTKTTRFPDKKTFALTATDSGSPSLSTRVTVTFNIDEENSEPYTPKFKKSSFMYKYNSDTRSISAVNDEVTLEENKDGIQCELEGDLASYFNEPIRKGVTIKISIKNQLPDDIIVKTAATVSVKCYMDPDFSSMADVTILFPEDAQSTTSFSKAVYSGELSVQNDVQSIVMDDKITIENYVDNVIIKVEDTYDKYFEILKTKEKSWYLSKKPNADLDDSQLQQYSLDVIISLVVQENNRVLDKAVVTLLLPNGGTSISFTTPVITGTYTFDANNGDKCDIPSEVSLNSKYFDFQKAFVKEYPEIFQAKFHSPDTFEIVKTGNLPRDLLKEGVVPLTLHVDFKLAGVSQSAETVLILYLSEEISTTTTEESTTTSSTTEISTSTSSTKESTTTTSSTETSTSTSSTEESTTTTSSTETSTSTSSDGSTTPDTTTNNSPTTNEPSNECDSNNTVWIILVVVLFLILVIYVGATIFYYFKKLRNRRNLSELPQPTTRVEPLFQKRLSHDHKLKEVSSRRPTGFIRYNPDLEEGSVQDEEINNNTASNKVIESPDEDFKKVSENGKNVGFKDTTEVEPSTLAEELKRAVQGRESRLI